MGSLNLNYYLYPPLPGQQHRQFLLLPENKKQSQKFGLLFYNTDWQPTSVSMLHS